MNEHHEIPTTAALKTYRCSICDKDRFCVIKVDSDLICVRCRFENIGINALYEGLYNDLD